MALFFKCWQWKMHLRKPPLGCFLVFVLLYVCETLLVSHQRAAASTSLHPVGLCQLCLSL